MDIVQSRLRIDGAQRASERPVEDISGNGQPGDGIRDSNAGFGLEYTRPEQTSKPPVADSDGGGRPGDSFGSDTGYGLTFDRPQDRQNDSAPRGDVAAPAPPAPERLDRDGDRTDLEE